MTIDLRYVIPIAAFYAPGLLLLTGAWALGYSTREVREIVAGVGALMGVATTCFAGAVVFISAQPMRIQIGRKK